MLGLDITITVKHEGEVTNFSWQEFKKYYLGMKVEARTGEDIFSLKLMIAAIEATIFSFAMNLNKEGTTTGEEEKLTIAEKALLAEAEKEAKRRR